MAPGNTGMPDRLAWGSWTRRREELADKLVVEAERRVPGLRKHTRTRLILTPDDFRSRTHQDHLGHDLPVGPESGGRRRSAA